MQFTNLIRMSCFSFHFIENICRQSYKQKILNLDLEMRYIDVEKNTYGAGTSNPSEAPEFTPVFVLGDGVQFQPPRYRKHFKLQNEKKVMTTLIST